MHNFSTKMKKEMYVAPEAKEIQMELEDVVMQVGGPSGSNPDEG